MILSVHTVGTYSKTNLPPRLAHLQPSPSHVPNVLTFVHTHPTRQLIGPPRPVTKLRVTSILLYLRIKVDSRQSIEPLVWWTSGGTHIPEITGSILVAVIIFPTSSHLVSELCSSTCSATLVPRAPSRWLLRGEGCNEVTRYEYRTISTD